MKLFYELAIVGGLFAASVSPASAWWNSGSMVMNHNDAVVTNNITTTAITGMNTQGSTIMLKRAGADDLEVEGNNYLSTGVADAFTNAKVVANVSAGCGCTTRTWGTTKTFNTNEAVISNTALTQVDTGDNMQGNGISVEMAHADDIEVEGDNTLFTGAGTARTRSMIVVNTQWNGVQ